MCKHEEIVLASRNAIVGLWSSLSPYEKLVTSLDIRNELARRENAYDALLQDLDKECKSCEADRRNPFRKSDFLRFVDEFVTHFGSKKCEDC